ncbi:MAG: ATP-binding protein [Caldilinea sp.]|nr:response regulator [Caldilinea sp.]MCB0066262.1 response regulator [Caldilineaceae bacterium]MCB9114785.1 response regulator [Caldilineaceae bacterium]MCB9120353.1 response regulator [Caldilineaceae bacterium]MCO5208605.1 ATP-binding protein [Caldilinea sp.]
MTTDKPMRPIELHDAEYKAILADFAREALRVLLGVTLFLAWGWSSFVTLFDSSRALSGFFLVALAGLSTFVVFQLAATRLRAAVIVYVLALIAQISVVVLAYEDAVLLALYLLVVLVSAPLLPPRGLGVVTLLTILAVIMAGIGRSTAPVDMVLPVLLTLLAALAAWLSTRRLFTALEWALNMTERAQRSTEEAREHRFELQKVLHSLDLALARLERSNRALVFAQEAAEKAYRFKSEFVANVSHELRTPLNLIVGFSEMMTTAPESYGGKPLPGEYRGDMVAIYRSSRHLLDLINDVLDLSQIESGRMAIHKERTELGELIQEAADIVRGLAEARRLHLQVDLPAAPLAVDLDRIRIRQVLLNLLTNAMRYTEQGTVHLGATCNAEEVTVLVQDSGRGIAPDKLARAFEAFDRLDEEELTHGSGLGLAVSKKFVDLHRGRMWIESEPEKGTTVGFTLPLPAQAEGVPLGTIRLSRPLAEDGGRPLVLVIHDDPRAVGLLRRHVDGCDFVLAEDAGQIRSVLAETLPDTVLVERDSLGEWEAVVAEGMSVALPVLIAPLPSVHHFGAMLGASDFLPKPVTRDDVAYVLQRLAVQPRTALVIDDDPHIVRLIGRMLRSLVVDVQVLEAFDGEEGLAVARSRRPDLVFVDLQMPGMGGEQFIDALAGEPDLAETPVVVVSVRSVEQENAAIHGGLTIQREQGFALSELLGLLDTTLAAITRPDVVSPASAAARLAALAG